MKRGASNLQTTIVAVIAVLALIVSIVASIEASKLAESVDQVRSQNQQILTEIRDITNNTKTLNELVEKVDRLSVNVSKLQDSVVTREQYEQLLNNLQQVSAELARLREQYNETVPQLSELQVQVREISEKLRKLEDQVLFPAEFTDGSGYKVIVPSRPQRIVSLAPSVTEILYFINATDRLIGVDSYSDWPEWIAEARSNGTLVEIGGPWNPSVEQILALDPDLVIGVASISIHKEVREVLSAYGIPVVLLPDANLEDIRDSLIMAGKATGNVVEAAIAAGQFEASLAKFYVLSKNVEERPRIAILVWVNPAWVAGSGTFQGDMIEEIGAVNAFANITGWAMVNPEEFLNAKPDIIVAPGIPVESIYEYFNQTLGDSALEIPAIANGQVYCVGEPYSNMMNRPSPRVITAMDILQMIAFPDLYGVEEIPQCINATTLPSPPTPPQP